MAVGDVYRLSARWERNTSGDDIVNVWHFQQNGPPIEATPAEDLITAFGVEASAVYAGITSVAYTLNLYSVKQVTGGIEVAEQAVSVPGLRGTVDTQLPAQNSCVLTWKSGLAGRRRNGRTFMPVTDEADIIQGQYIAGYLSGVSAFATNLIVDMFNPEPTHGSWRLVIFSQPDTVPPPVPATLITPVAAGIPKPIPGTIRRRRLGVGS